MKKKASEMVSKNTLENLEKKNINLRYNLKGKSKTAKYSKQHHLHVFRGYDLLENLIAIRPYIQKKNNIDLGLLEILLYLSSRQFFTQADFREMPKQLKYGSIKNLIATGFVGIVQEGENLGKHVYKINRKGHEIVRNFYELLSGEKNISENQYENPLTRKKTRTPFDKKRMDLITKINQLPAPETKKGFYQ
jgi:hypothetical protein